MPPALPASQAPEASACLPPASALSAFPPVRCPPALSRLRLSPWHPGSFRQAVLPVLPSVCALTAPCAFRTPAFSVQKSSEDSLPLPMRLWRHLYPPALSPPPGRHFSPPPASDLSRHPVFPQILPEQRFFPPQYFSEEFSAFRPDPLFFSIRNPRTPAKPGVPPPSDRQCG